MLYKIELTDTFGGEANYSYVNRLTMQAKSLRACVLQLGRAALWLMFAAFIGV